MNTFKYGVDFLQSSTALKIAEGTIEGVLTEEVIAGIKRSAGYVQDIVDAGKVVYGINTGFGPLCNAD